MAEALDPVGNISLILQVTILFLLVLGLPFVKGLGSKKNFLRHGYLTALAVALHTILIFVVMVPALLGELSEIPEIGLLDVVNVWSHVILGTIAEALGVLLVVAWLRKPPSAMACSRWKKWMLPTFPYGNS